MCHSLQQSPVLRLGEGVWPFDVRLDGAKRLRILVLRGPVAQAGKMQGVHGGSREWVVNQDAYDLVDFVNAAFVDDSHVGIAPPANE